MGARLPFLVTVPHGGETIPPEVHGRIALDKAGLFEDSDAFTAKLFDVGDLVCRYLAFPVFRAIVDPSRSRSELPPVFPDGCIKSHTCYGKRIYKPGMQPDGALTEMLLNIYYQSYHAEIASALKDERVIMLLDCHSMAPVGPPVAPDPGKERPLICIGNNSGHSCSLHVTEVLADLFRSVLDLDGRQVTVNVPFKGGHITRKYGNNPKPALQIEINRKYYMYGSGRRSMSPAVYHEKFADFIILFRKILSAFEEALRQLAPIV